MINASVNHIETYIGFMFVKNTYLRCFVLTFFFFFGVIRRKKYLNIYQVCWSYIYLDIAKNSDVLRPTF